MLQPGNAPQPVPAGSASAPVALVGGACRIAHLPDHHGCNLDRVAVQHGACPQAAATPGSPATGKSAGATPAVPPPLGAHPVLLSVAAHVNGAQSVACVAVRFAEGTAERWPVAAVERRDPGELGAAAGTR